MTHYVYVIVNKINLKLYFGSHSWDGEGLDPSYYGSGKIIKQAVKKYGKDNFIVYPIKFYNTVEECRKAEEELLTKYNIANNIYCYNIKNAAVGFTSDDMKGKTKSEEHRKKLSQVMKGKAFSEEYRKKLSQAKKGKPLSEDTKRKMSKAKNDKKIPLVAIDINGKVKIFESQRECSRVLGIHLGSINMCLQGKRNSTGGYLIKYLKRCSKDYKITKRKAKETEKIKLPTIKRKGKTPVVAIQIDTGKIKIFKSIIECARQLNLNPGNIHSSLKGRIKQTGGYTFKYVEQLESEYMRV